MGAYRMTYNIRTKREKMMMEDSLLLRFTKSEGKMFDDWLAKHLGVKN